MTVRKKMAEGVLWSFLEKGGVQVASLVVFMVVARLIGPEEYGLVSLCMVYIGLIITLFFFLLDGVVSEAIEGDRRFSTAFWGATAVGLVFSIIGILMAYIMPIIFGEPRLKPLMMTLSVIPILLGMAALPNAINRQKMNFKTPAFRTMVATLSGGAVGIVMAVKGYGAYAIIAQQIVHYTVVNVVLWFLLKWCPKLQFNLQDLKIIMAPGFKSSSYNLITFAQESLPRLLIGGVLSAEAVGYYAFATRITAALCEILFAPLSTVIFPALSSIRDHLEDQKKILSEVMLIIGIIVFPVVCGAIIVAQPFISLVFGAEWAPSVVVFQIVVASAVVMSFIRVISSIFRAHNAIGGLVLPQVILTVGSLFACYVVAPLGIVAVSICYTAFTFISLVVYTVLLKMRLQFNFWAEYKALIPVLVAAFGMVLVVVVAQDFIAGQLNHEILYLIALICLGGVVYLLGLAALLRKKIVVLMQFIARRKARNV